MFGLLFLFFIHNTLSLSFLNGYNRQTKVSRLHSPYATPCGVVVGGNLPRESPTAHLRAIAESPLGMKQEKTALGNKKDCLGIKRVNRIYVKM